MVRAGSSGACMQIADFVERVKLIILKDDSSDGTSTKLDELEKQLKWKNVRTSDSKALALVDKKGKNGSLKVVLEDTGLFQLSSDESVVELKSNDPDVLGEAPEEDAGEKKLKSAPEASSPDAKGGGSALCNPSQASSPNTKFKKISYFYRVNSSLVKACSVCGSETDKRCTGCSSVYYCSRKCQAEDWKLHKMVCAKLKSNNEVIHDNEKKKTPKETPFQALDGAFSTVFHEGNLLGHENWDEEGQEEEPGANDSPLEDYFSDDDDVAPTCALCDIASDPVSGCVLMRCTGCRKAHYCSREHQKIHWAAHKYVCGNRNDNTVSNSFDILSSHTGGVMKPVTMDLTNLI